MRPPFEFERFVVGFSLCRETFRVFGEFLRECELLVFTFVVESVPEDLDFRVQGERP